MSGQSSQGSSSELHIRAASASDAPVLSLLAMRLTAFELPRWRKPQEIATADAGAMIDAVRAGSSDNEVFLAERDGDVVGCLHMIATTDFFGRRHAHISVVATSEAAEGTGVGRALLARAEEWTKARGLAMLTLNVFAGNDRARRFYDKAGFAPETVKYVKEL